MSHKLIISSTSDGTMQLVGGAQAQVNREIFCKKVGIDVKQVVAAQLANSNKIAVVGDHDAGTVIPTTDGLITTCPDIFLSITVADCLPIMIYSPGKSVALLHAGWRGLAGDIITKAYNILVKEICIDPGTLLVQIGPGIESHHYPVGQGVAEMFAHYPGTATRINDEYLLDLKAISIQQLSSLEISKDRITISPICTYCDNAYFSARRDKNTPVSAMMVVVNLF